MTADPLVAGIGSMPGLGKLMARADCGFARIPAIAGEALRACRKSAVILSLSKDQFRLRAERQN
jgi:hypothetical protein